MTKITRQLTEEGMMFTNEPIPPDAEPLVRVLKGGKAPQPVVPLERPPPYSSNAERGLLSCFLQNPSDLLFDARGSIEPEAFHHPVNRMVYQEMLSFRDYTKLTLVTFSQRMIDKGLMEKIGGPSFLAELLNFIPTPSEYPYDKAILLEKYRLRQIIEESSAIIDCAYSYHEEPSELENDIRSKTSAIDSLFKTDEKERRWEDVVAGVEDDWKLCYGGKRPSAMPSPWPSWNRTLGGIRRGYLLILGHRKKGKSSLAGHIAIHTSVQLKERSLIVTYETNVADYILRMASNISGVHGDFLFKPDISKPATEHALRISKAMAVIKSSNMKIIRGNGMSTREIEFECDKFRPSLVVIDYLLLMSRLPETNIKEGTEGIVRGNSNAIINLSRKIDGTVIVLNHIADTGDRKGESRFGASAENDADLTLMVEDDGIKVKSCRNGESGAMMPIRFDGRRYKFVESTVPINNNESEPF